MSVLFYFYLKMYLHFQNLERAFQDFHYQATNITALPSAAPPVTDQRPSSHKADIPLQTGKLFITFILNMLDFKNYPVVPKRQ